MFEKIKSYISNFIVIALLYSIIRVVLSGSIDYIYELNSDWFEIVVLSLVFSLNLTLWNAVETQVMTRAELTSDAWLKTLAKFRAKLITDDTNYAEYDISFIKLMARREISIKTHQSEDGYLIVNAPKRIFHEYKQEV